MKSFFKKYRHLIGLGLVMLFAFCLCMISSKLAPLALFIVGCYQLMQFAMSKQCGVCFTPLGLTPEQIKEFEKICGELKDFGSHIPALRELAVMEGGFAAIKALPNLLKSEQKRVDELQGEIKKLRKSLLSQQGTGSGVRWVGNKPFVSDECAKAFASLFIVCCQRQEKWPKQWSRGDVQEQVLNFAQESLGFETRAALASSDIPLPTVYVPQVVELVWKYGQFRQFATVFPLGAGTVNLPQLKVGEDAFALIAASAAVGEKKVAAQNVTFTALKVGGIIRVPTEIEEDTFIPLGQFLARYISRRFAIFEDTFGFVADKSATYNLQPGVCQYAVDQNVSVQLAAGKTKPTDATLANFRAMRAKVNAAVYSMDPAYYMHPSMEALLVTFNTVGAPLIYRPAQGGQPATLDGFPIRWSAVFQQYQDAAAASKFLAAFGALEYWYLGERGQPRVETSREVYFATDEIGMRALERVDFEPMAPDAMSSLQLAAA